MSEGSCHRVDTAIASGQAAIPADGVLLEAVRLGDSAAFEALFERHYPRVYSVALRVVGSPEDAEEIANDVFLKLYQRPLEKVVDGALAGWLYRSALNAAFNRVRSRNRRRGWLQKVAMFQRTESHADTNPAVVVERNEEIDQVRRHLARLPEKQRNALVLRSQGLQYNEIAATLDISPSSVGTTLARGEKALRRHLENEVEA